MDKEVQRRAINHLDGLTQDQRDRLGREILLAEPKSPEDAAALAVLAYLLGKDDLIYWERNCTK
jgi:hypothetical protein